MQILARQIFSHVGVTTETQILLGLCQQRNLTATVGKVAGCALLPQGGIVGKRCGYLPLFMTFLTQTVWRTRQQTGLPFSRFVGVVTTEALTLLVSAMHTSRLGFFLMAIEAQLLRRLFQPAGIITGMRSMTGEAISVPDRRVLLQIVGIGAGRIVTRQAQQSCRLGQSKGSIAIGAIMATLTLPLRDWSVNIVPQQKFGRRRVGQVAIVTAALHCVATVLSLDPGCGMAPQTLVIGIFGKEKGFFGAVGRMTAAATLFDRLVTDT
jgi:hypothetical protein